MGINLSGILSTFFRTFGSPVRSDFCLLLPVPCFIFLAVGGKMWMIFTTEMCRKQIAFNFVPLLVYTKDGFSIFDMYLVPFNGQLF